MITNDQIYSAITGFNPARLQPLSITPSGSAQVFDESDLTDGNIGFCPVTVSAAEVGGLLTVIPDTTGISVSNVSAQITIPDGVKAYSYDIDAKTLTPVSGTINLISYQNGTATIDDAHSLIIDPTSLTSAPIGTDIVVTFTNATPSGSYSYVQVSKPNGFPASFLEMRNASVTGNVVYYARVVAYDI